MNYTLLVLQLVFARSNFRSHHKKEFEMSRVYWFVIIFVNAIIFGMISGAPIRPDAPRAIAEVSQPTAVGTPFGDTLMMTDVTITVTPDD